MEPMSRPTCLVPVGQATLDRCDATRGELRAMGQNRRDAAGTRLGSVGVVGPTCGVPERDRLSEEAGLLLGGIAAKAVVVERLAVEAFHEVDRESLGPTVVAR